MELSQVLCELSLLSQIQGKETPSRDHASDREEAEKFKDLEDLGDNLFKGMELKDLFFIFATKNICRCALHCLAKILHSPSSETLS